MAQKRPRLNSKLEATGAEHLVLGHLLIEGIQSFIAPAGQRDYDIIATNPEANTSCRVQVKSRWATDANLHFFISKFDTDIVVLVRLNRGVRYRKARPGDEGARDPDFFILPVEVVRTYVHAGKASSSLRLREVPDYEDYLNRWDLVRKFLGTHTDGAS